MEQRRHHGEYGDETPTLLVHGSEAGLDAVNDGQNLIPVAADINVRLANQKPERRHGEGDSAGLDLRRGPAENSELVSDSPLIGRAL